MSNSLTHDIKGKKDHRELKLRTLSRNTGSVIDETTAQT